MRTVIADSNALLMPFKTSINLDSELRRLLGTYKIVVPAPIIGELKKLEKTLPHAKSALRLARTKEIIETEAQGDKAVIEAAEMVEGGIILTNDKELIGVALKKGIPIIRLVGGNRLELTDYKNG